MVIIACIVLVLSRSLVIVNTVIIMMVIASLVVFVVVITGHRHSCRRQSVGVVVHDFLLALLYTSEVHGR